MTEISHFSLFLIIPSWLEGGLRAPSTQTYFSFGWPLGQIFFRWPSERNFTFHFAPCPPDDLIMVDPLVTLALFWNTGLKKKKPFLHKNLLVAQKDEKDNKTTLRTKESMWRNQVIAMYKNRALKGDVRKSKIPGIWNRFYGKVPMPIDS